MPEPVLLTAEPPAWRDLSRTTRRQVWTAVKLGDRADDPRVAVAAAEWAVVQARRLTVAMVTANVVGGCAVVLSTLTVLGVIPPLVHLRPAWGTVRDYAGWWLMGAALLSFRAGHWAKRKRRRTSELQVANTRTVCFTKREIT